VFIPKKTPSKLQYIIGCCMNPYDVISRYYDIEHRGLTEDIELYRQFAARNDGAVLVVGSGTGRVALALASPGREVWGLDNNAAMLEIARRSPCPVGDVSWREADMTAFEFDKSFSLIVVPLDTFTSLRSVEQQRAALLKIGEHLNAAGLLVVDVVNPITLPTASEEGLVRLRHRSTVGATTYTVFDSVEVDPAAQQMILHLTYEVSRDTELARECADLDVRWLYRFEFEHLCASAGLRVLHVYGNYDLSPYETASPRMVFVAEAVCRSRFGRCPEQALDPHP
jgi:ubiquinone/menaquinone biosynthesis C-methylase UbiE